MAGQQLGEAEQQEIQALQQLFTDLDPVLVEHVYLAHDCDYKAAQHALAELATHPASAAAVYANLPLGRHAAGPPAGTLPLAHAPADERIRGSGDGSGGGAGGLEALASAPEPRGDGYDNRSSGVSVRGGGGGGGGTAYAQAGPFADSATVNIADALTQVGATAIDGIATLASNLTAWVADLASAFEATWMEETSEDGGGASGSHGRTPGGGNALRDAPSIGLGGSAGGIERPYQRRHQLQSAASGGPGDWAAGGGGTAEGGAPRALLADGYPAYGGDDANDTYNSPAWESSKND